MSQEYPFVRITILGGGGSGKTSLINSFVNNGISKDSVSTTFPELYYRVVRLPPENDPKGKMTSVCVEIEDTPFPESGDEASTHVISPNLYMQQAPTDSVSLAMNRLKDIVIFFNMERRNESLAQEGSNTFLPFSRWKPPMVPISYDRKSYAPLTSGRMGFMIVFDVTDGDSLDCACEIYTALANYIAAKKIRIHPYIYLIANKTDKDPQGEDVKRNLLRAEAFTQERFIRLINVSAFTAKNVKRAFWDLLYLILGDHVLWEIEHKDSKEGLQHQESNEDEQTSGCRQS